VGHANCPTLPSREKMALEYADQILGGIKAPSTVGSVANDVSTAVTNENISKKWGLGREARVVLIGGLSAPDSSGKSQILILSAATEPNGQNSLLLDLQGAVLAFSAPTAASVGVASASAVAANSSRRYLCLVNTSANDISLGFDGNAAVLGSGVTITPNGSYEMSKALGNLNLGAITAIAGGAASNLSIQEAT